MSLSKFHLNIQRTGDQIGASDASLTICQYIPTDQTAATSPPVHDAAPMPVRRAKPLRRWDRWLQIGLARDFHWTRRKLAISHLPPELAGFRIVHLTDTHLGRHWLPGFDPLIARLRDDPPDLIVFTGDFVDHKYDSRLAIPVVQKLVRQLTSRLGIYAITGNHDGDLICPFLPSLGVNLINHRYVRLANHRAAIELIGLAGTKRWDFDAELIEQIPAKQTGVPRIVLGHFPDLVRYIGGLDADVMLCGHTHGGQICLPDGCPIMTHDSLPKRMASGEHQVNGTRLIVSRGMGVGKYPIRIFCPPEVVELTLSAGDAQV